MYQKSIKDKDPIILGCDAALCTFRRKKLNLSSKVKREEENSSRIVECRTFKVVYEFRIVEGSDLGPNLMNDSEICLEDLGKNKKNHRITDIFDVHRSVHRNVFL
jgi:hypothetical protein